MARRGKNQQVNPDDLRPAIAKGLTQGASAREALEEFPVKETRSGVEIARDFSRADQKAALDLRDDSVHFIPRLDPETRVIEPNTGRQMIDVTRIIPYQHKQQILAGVRCLECLEHFGGDTFPLFCPLCGFEVRERQILKATMEFEGEVHVGPSKPLREIAEEQDARVEKRKFIAKVLDGKAARIPSEWLRDATLMEGLSLDEQEALGAKA